jgi:outer membrane protein W
MRPFRVLVLVLASYLCSTTALAAQEHATDRGSFIVGGSAGLTSQKNGDHRYTHMHLRPSVQYFVQPGLALGGTLNLWQSRIEGRTMTAYGAGPQASYYFGGAEQALRPYVSGQTTYSAVRGEDPGVLTTGANLGVVYLFTRNIGLDASLFYSRMSSTGSVSSASMDSMGLAVGFSAFAF